MEQVRYLTIAGVVSPETYTIDHTGTDRKGILLLQQVGATKKVRTHPSRILPILDSGPNTAIVTHDGELFKATCPSCHEEIEVDPGDKTTCPTCNTAFKLNWRDVGNGPTIPIPEAEVNGKPPKKPTKKAGAKAKVIKQPKADTTIDFAIMKKAGELWTTGNIEFDYPEFTVLAHVLIITGKKPRKFCFNSYNGTYGKKPRAVELQSFIDEQQPPGGKIVWYYIKGPIEQQRTKLEKDGYHLDK